MKNIGKIIRLAKPLHGILYLITGLITLGALIELLTPWLLKLIIETLQSVPKVSESAPINLTGGPFLRVTLLVLAMFAANLAGQALTNISSRIGDHFAGRLRKYLTEKFFEHSLTLSQTYFDTELSGKIMSQLNRGVQVISDFFNTATNFIVPSFLQAIFTIVVLAYYSPLIALFVSALFPIYIYLSARSTQAWVKYQQGRNTYEDVVRGRLTETILNIRLVRGFNNQLGEVKTVREAFVKINEFFAKQSTIFHVYDFFRNGSLYIVLTGVFITLFYQAYTGAVTFGDVVLIIQLINQIRRPLFAMSFVLGRIQEAETGSKEYFNILELPSREPLVLLDNKPKEIKNPTITFDNVSFAYDEHKEVLHNLTFKIDRHETVALVGKSGAGKTTITNLIMKFYDATSGSISMGEYPYSDLTTRDVRSNIALVFQDHELFSTSIRENVAYGMPGASDEAIKKALEHAQAWDFVKELPKGVDSEVGERGVRLSGGQKQRIQIARAILKNAPILILDEATSSLDAQSELQVQEALEYLTKNRLVLVIAHRFSTIRNADRIIVLDNGKIIDQGSPKELATREGIYQNLLKFQVEGNKKLLESFELH
ncbi:MAG: ABC transporter ATP-binding protein [Patescibacteria group bacterium]